MDKYARQVQLEKEAYEFSYNKAINEITKQIQCGLVNEMPEGKLLIIATVDKVASKLDEYFKADLKGNLKRDREILIDYFDRSKDLAFLLLSTIINTLSLRDNVSIIEVADKLVKAIKSNYICLKLKEEHPKLYSHIEREYKKRGKAYIHSRKTKLGMMKANLDKDIITARNLQLGTLLIDLVIKSGCNIVKIVTEYNNNKRVSKLLFTDEAFDIILKGRNSTLLNYKVYPILIVPPADWTSFIGSGGYYTDIFKMPLIKTRGKNKQLLNDYFTKNFPTRFVDIVNKIQKTSWRINKRVYDIIDIILTDNLIDHKAPINSPYLIGGLPYNRKQEASDYINVYDYGEVWEEGKYAGMPKDRQKYKEWYRDTEIQKERILVNISKAVALRLAMSDAKKYLNESEIYFSYQADFRGRIYPIQQHLNPQAKGLIKSLLEFSEGVPITTDEQLKWFKIHGANCYGYDKEEYEERVRLIDEKEQEIRQIVKDPIRYSHLWKDTEEPFLYLAWCYEYVDYLTDSNSFRSHIPIAIDATCSGIQIYSGLLLDKEGAEAVNVIGNTRQDIYKKVADVVNHYLTTGDYNDTINFKKSDGTVNVCSTKVEADSLKGNITRKLTKRNVMTQPYSVTRYGMYQQLMEELDDMEDNNKAIWRGDKWVVARLLTELNDRAIVETVKGARVGQEFLKTITKTLVKDNQYVFYTTPIIEFPVLQKIHKNAIERVRTELGSLVIKTPTNEIHNQKMVNGIAPNYIHSLDSTLLYLTVEKLTTNSYHLIHDSYGVPINAIEELNKAVRDSFIELFSTKPLYKFVKQLGLEDTFNVDDVMINTLDIKEVADSRYIFS